MRRAFISGKSYAGISPWAGPESGGDRMGFAFETLGNATIQIFKDGTPILATDP